MSGYERSFLCTLHNLRFAFDDHPSVDYALLRCPVCSYEREQQHTRYETELRQHRDLLLKVIDLKRLVVEAPAQAAGSTQTGERGGV